MRNRKQDRSPVLRSQSGRDVLITLLSFVFSVSATRLFLEITGYPQIGGGEIHIAHVLWGGLLLFAAALIPIIYANEWAATLAALLAGLGVGLFIDEVGKFITSTNDYFYPSAAPIVYVFFLLTVLLVFRVRAGRPKSNRALMYEVFEELTEVTDRDFSPYEREQLLQKLAQVRHSGKDADLVQLADALHDYLVAKKPCNDSIQPDLLDRMRISWAGFERKVLTRSRLKRVVIAGLLICGVWALISPVFYVSISRNSDQLQLFLNALISQNLVNSASGLTWFEAKVILEGGVGLVAIVGAVFMICRAEKPGSWIGMVGLLVALTLVNLLVFYFEQFSTIAMAVFQFLVFVLILRYRKRFIKDA